MGLDESVSLRVDMASPTLGMPLLSLTQTKDVAPPIAWQPCPVVLPPAPAESLQPQLDALHEQLIILRAVSVELLAYNRMQHAMIADLQADLAARTWTARWQRCLNRCRQIWRQLTGE